MASFVSARAFFLNFLLPVLAASASGFFLAQLDFPLAWLMGAAIVTGALALSGWTIVAPQKLQWVALIVVGSSVGLSLTSEAATRMLEWAPVMVMSGLIAVALAAFATPLLSRSAKVSPATAFFSLLPGGIIEMANIGETFNANRTVVASLHAIRVGLLVFIIPFGLFWYTKNQTADVPGGHILAHKTLLLVLVIGLAGGALFKRYNLPSAFLLGPLIFVAAFSALQGEAGAMPTAMLNVAQVILGFALGARFRRAEMASMPRALVAAVIILPVIMLGMALVATGAAGIVPETVPTLVLASSIGGMAEMVLTAKALGQNAAIVAAFHIVRAVLVNFLAGSLWSALSRFSFLNPDHKG